MTDRYVGYDVSESTYAEVENVSGDSIFEQTELTYDDAGNLIRQTVISRYHDETGTGELVAGTDGRPSHTALWHDALGRQIAMAAYGNQDSDGTSFSRPATVPARSDTVLVTSTEYNDDGEAFKTIDPMGKEDWTEFDDAGRTTRTIENHVDGDPDNLGFDQDVAVEFTYTPDGNIATITAKNRKTGDQTTTYTYGTDGSSEVFRNDLVVKETYPDSAGGSDVVEYTYNRQAELLTQTDQNGTLHTFIYDGLGRRTEDQVTSLGSSVDPAVQRIETAYEVRGMPQTITSYDHPTAGNAMPSTRSCGNTTTWRC